MRLICMQMNKNGIRVVNNNKDRKKLQQELRKLNYKEYAEFKGYENGIEVTVIVPNHKPLVQAMLQDGFVLQRFSRGEIA